MKRSVALLAGLRALAPAYGGSPARRPMRAQEEEAYQRSSSPLLGTPTLSGTEGGGGASGQRQTAHMRAGEDTNGRCGSSYGSCATGYCCSAAGWCGQGPSYCTSLDCLIDYGPFCDGNRRPAGVDTSTVPRPRLGDLPYGGEGIYHCGLPGDIAITFDDGPWIYTSTLLDKLASYGAKATFFVTGNNLGKGMINDPSTPYPAIIRRMHAEGHQIGSHTWSHQDASELSDDVFTQQIIWNEVALGSILGFFPTYMRPPYSSCPPRCQSLLGDLGYLLDDPALIQRSKDIWDAALRGSDPAADCSLHIEHDIHRQTVLNLTDYILASAAARGYRAVTVGRCLGDPEENWYRAGRQ